ncbi:MAG: hypothetical protein ACOX21_04400 [Bacillota bacterium]|nr:hypothetical protein [Bacillota bacterium]
MNKKPTVLLSCSLKFESPQGRQEAEALLTDNAFEFKPKYGDAKTYSYREILKIQAADYRLSVQVKDEKLDLLHLGNKYEDFVRVLIGQRNETIINDLLMQERVRRGGIAAICSVKGDQGKEVDLGNCELRLCDTALLIIPDYHEPVRVPYSFVTSVQADGYILHIRTEDGVYSLSKLGREFTPFSDDFDAARQELMAKAQGLLRELAPTAAPAAIHQAAGLMGEGRAVRRRDIEQIDPAMWKSFERQLDVAGIRQEYEFLTALAGTDQQCIGFKQDLAQKDSPYLWFLIPIPGSNAIAMEATSSAEAGRATYFFRIVSREQFPKLKKDIMAKAEDLVMEINRCMLAINFRREPIYLAEEKLTEPRYLKYYYSVLRLPELQKLRRLFIGRVFHREQAQWEQDTRELLAFNAASRDDAAKWAKATSEPDADEENGASEEAPENGG